MLVIKRKMEIATKAMAVALAFVIPLSNSVTTILAIVYLLCWAFAVDKDKFYAGIKHPISQAIFVFITIYILGILYTLASGNEISQALRKSTRLLYFPLIVPFFVAQRWRFAVLGAYLLAIFITVVACMLIYNPFFKDNIFTSMYVAYACFVLGHISNSIPRARIFTIPVLLLFTYYLFFLSIGRTGQVIFMLLYTLFCLQVFGKHLKKMLLAVAVFTALVVSVLYLPSTFSARHATAANEVQTFLQDSNAPIAESSMGLRLTFARNAIELVKQKPILGWGTGSFARAYLQQFPQSRENHSYTVNPHNQYLLIAVELGLVGLLALVSVFGTMAWVFLRSNDLFGRLGLGLVAAIATGCLANSWLLDFTSMYFFAIYSAALAGGLTMSSRT